MQSYFTNPEPAFYPGAYKAPVPGWGNDPSVMGPARVGVGAVFNPSVAKKFAQVERVQPKKTAHTEWTPALECSQMGGSYDASTGVCTLPDVGGGASDGGIPLWYWFVGIAVLGAGGLFAYKKGYLGKVHPKLKP